MRQRDLKMNGITSLGIIKTPICYNTMFYDECQREFLKKRLKDRFSVSIYRRKKTVFVVHYSHENRYK